MHAGRKERNAAVATRERGTKEERPRPDYETSADDERKGERGRGDQARRKEESDKRTMSVKEGGENKTRLGVYCARDEMRKAEGRECSRGATSFTPR